MQLVRTVAVKTNIHRLDSLTGNETAFNKKDEIIEIGIISKEDAIDILHIASLSPNFAA